MTTQDYSQFRNITGNREISEAHVDNLVEAIENKNLLPFFPVLVNEKMEVIDGQHRLMAAAKLNTPIYYEKIEGLTIKDVMSLNTHSKNWDLADFVQAYIKMGHKNYETLLDFSTRHHLSLGTAAGILSGYVNFTNGGGHHSRLIKEGNFKVLSEHYAESVAEMIDKIARYAEFKVRTDRRFIGTMMKLRNNPDFDFDRLLGKLQVHDLMLHQRVTVPQYLMQIEEIYNFNVKSDRARVELYASTQKL